MDPQLHGPGYETVEECLRTDLMRIKCSEAGLAFWEQWACQRTRRKWRKQSMSTFPDTNLHPLDQNLHYQCFELSSVQPPGH